MNMPAFVASVIFGVMIAEARLSRSNDEALRQAGATRPSGDPYWAIVTLYPLAFLCMAIEGAWRVTHPAASAFSGPAWAVSGLLLFVASKALKYWAIRALGVRWSVRVWILPGQRLVHAGPYRYVAHPNYIAVMGELAGAAMMMGARISGPLTIALFGLALAARIRFENRILAAMLAQSPQPDVLRDDRL